MGARRAFVHRSRPLALAALGRFKKSARLQEGMRGAGQGATLQTRATSMFPFQRRHAHRLESA
eukprot:scaffold201740_cov31-Tisochrysis_lutea.AAC.4